MSVCYIILTCENYLPTRCEWQRNTFLKIVNGKDVYFLSCKNSGESVYGWDTPDNYDSCPLKYIRFFKNMTLNYDWYFFIDDDTFINVDNLHNLLQTYDKEEPYYIGRLCTNYNPPFHMSGGAGFLLSRSLYLSLIEYIRNTPENKLMVSINGDLSLAIWLKNINNKKVINNNNFHPTKHTADTDLTNFISFHYLKSLDDFLFYYNLNIKNT